MQGRQAGGRVLASGGRHHDHRPLPPPSALAALVLPHVFLGRKGGLAAGALLPRLPPRLVRPLLHLGQGLAAGGNRRLGGGSGQSPAAFLLSRQLLAASTGHRPRHSPPPTQAAQCRCRGSGGCCQPEKKQPLKESARSLLVAALLGGAGKAAAGLDRIRALHLAPLAVGQHASADAAPRGPAPRLERGVPQVGGDVLEVGRRRAGGAAGGQGSVVLE